MSEFYEFYEERKRKHYHQRHELEREGDYLRDPSCTECYPITFEPETYFHNFWEWYKSITPAETYNLYTVRQLEELIGSITYREKPDKTSKDIYQEILDRFTWSNRFELNNEEVEELLKNSDENNSGGEQIENNSEEEQIEDMKNNEELEDTEE